MKNNPAIWLLVLICGLFAGVILYHNNQNEEFKARLIASEQARIEAQRINEEARVELERLRKYNDKNEPHVFGVTRSSTDVQPFWKHDRY